MKPIERDLILVFFGDKEIDPNDLVAYMRVSVQQKKIRSRLEKCMKKCLEEIEENAL